MGVGLLLEGEGDVVEAALGFVIDAYGAAKITSKAQAAERLGLRYDGNDGSRDDDVGSGLGALAEVVDDVARDGDGTGTEAGGGENGGWAVAGDDAGGGCVGVCQRAILWADAYRADSDVCARDSGAGVRAAGEGGRLEGTDGEGRGAGCLLARAGALLHMAGDGVVAGLETRGVDGGLGAGGGDCAAVGGPGVDGGLLGIQMESVGFDLDRIAGVDAGGLRSATEHNGIWRLDVAEAEDESCGELHVGERAESTFGSGGKEQRSIDDLGVLIVGLDGTDGEMLIPERKDVVEANAAGDSPAPHQVLARGAVGALATAKNVGEGNPATEGKTGDRAAFRGVDELAAGFAGA